jgi:hypothetical protein
MARLRPVREAAWLHVRPDICLCRQALVATAASSIGQAVPQGLGAWVAESV